MADPNLHDRPGNEAPAIVTSTNRARQGVTGHGVRYVLIFGIAGAVIAFVWLAMVYAAKRWAGVGPEIIRTRVAKKSQVRGLELFLRQSVP